MKSNTIRSLKIATAIVIAGTALTWHAIASGPSFEKLPKSAQVAVMSDEKLVDSLFRRAEASIRVGDYKAAEGWYSQASGLLGNIENYAPEAAPLGKTAGILRNFLDKSVELQASIDSLKDWMKRDIARYKETNGQDKNILDQGVWLNRFIRLPWSFGDKGRAINDLKDLNNKELYDVMKKMYNDQRTDFVETINAWIKEFYDLKKTHPNDDSLDGIIELLKTKIQWLSGPFNFD